MISIYDIVLEGIKEGEEINFADFRGKKIMIVNVASECGYTPQYQQLEELHRTFNDKIAIIGCPCNDFGGQEPGTNDEIHLFCTSTYDATFEMSTKLHILGEDRHPLYSWLITEAKNKGLPYLVEWNFFKFLINEEGQLDFVFPSAISPFDEPILNWISPS